MNNGFSGSVSAPVWPGIWSGDSPPSELTEVKAGEFVGVGPNQKWTYLTQPTTARYMAVPEDYTGDLYLFCDFGDGKVQSPAIYAANFSMKGNTNIYLQSGTFYAVYGGARAGGKDATLDGNTNITVGGSTSIYTKDVAQTSCIYGGGYADKGVTSTVTGSSNIHITGKATFEEKSSVFGGGYTDAEGGRTLVEGGSHILIDGGVANTSLKVHGGGWAYLAGTAEVMGGTRLELKDGGYAGEIFGGGRTSGTSAAVSIVDKVKIDVTGGEAGSVTGGGESNWFGLTRVTDGVEINVSGGKIGDLVGGGNVNGYYLEDKALLKGHSQVEGGVSINISGTAQVGEVYGGGLLSDKGTASTVEGGSIITMTGGAVNNIHGGGALLAEAEGLTKSTHDYNLLVSVDKSTLNIKGGAVAGDVFGGGKVTFDSTKYTEASTVLNQVGSTNVNISGGKLGSKSDATWVGGNVYGGGEGINAHVVGDSNVTITGGEMGSVTGGGLGSNTIGGNANVTISGGTIHGDVYAGSSDASSVIKGNATVKLEGTTWDIKGTINGGNAIGIKVLELSGISSSFGDKVGAERVIGFDKMSLTNGTVQDIGTLSSYGMTVDVNSGATLTWKDSSSATIGATLNQGGYFDANGAGLSDVTLGSGDYSWLTSNGGSIINFKHDETPVEVNVDVAVTAGDTLTVLSIGDEGSVTAAGGTIDVSQVQSEKALVLGSVNDSTGQGSSAQVLLDAGKNSKIIGGDVVSEASKKTVINSKSSMESKTLIVSGKGTILENNGDLSKVGKLTVNEGKLTGSGVFGSVEMTSGTLVVGNSPGSQQFASLALSSATNTVFSINGITASSSTTTSGWESNTHSQLQISGELKLADASTFTLELGSDFLAGLQEGTEYSFALVFSGSLSGDISKVKLAYSSYDMETGVSTSINSPFDNARLEARDTGTGTSIRFVGTAQSVPESSSVSLGLLGLMALTWRRRRNH